MSVPAFGRTVNRDGDLVRVVGTDADRLGSHLEASLPWLTVVAERTWTVERAPGREDCIVATNQWQSVLEDVSDGPPVVVVTPDEVTADAALEAGAVDVVQPAGGSTAELVVRRVEHHLQRTAPHDDRTLAVLHKTTRRLLAAENRREVASIVADAASGVLSYHGAGVRLYEPRREALVNVSIGGAAVEDTTDRPPLDIESTPHGEAFRTGETVVHEVDPDSPYSLDPFEWTMYVPLGNHGVLSVGRADPEPFDDDDHRYIEILARSAHAAMNRAEREQQLRAERDRLEAFATVVSHDFRNPLQVARARVELAREDCDSDHLNRVVDAHDRMERLVDNVLALARSDSVPADDTVDLAALARRAWSVVDGEDASLVVDGNPGTVAGSRGHVRQLYENLFRNAVEHAGRDVTVSLGPLAEETGWYVADDGPGIDPDERTRVLDGGYSTRDNGTGFGLAIVERIVEAHGWRVTVTDSQADGARFEFRID
jgi:K+-sensing histidine kinase KdpD